MPLLRENRFLPDLDSIPEDVLLKGKDHVHKLPE